MRSTRHQVPVCTCVLVFLLSSFDGPPLVVFVFLFWALLFRRNLHTLLPIKMLTFIVNMHTAQHRATSSAQVVLRTINSLDEPNHGPLLCPLHIYLYFYSSLRGVADGVSRPRRGALVDLANKSEIFRRAKQHRRTAVKTENTKHFYIGAIGFDSNYSTVFTTVLGRASTVRIIRRANRSA